MLAVAAFTGAIATVHADAKAADADSNVLKIGVPGDSLGFATFFLARELRYFADEGLDASFIYLTGNTIPGALVSGDIQATPLIGSVTRSRLAGYKVVNVALLLTKPPYKVLVRENIKSMSDLKNKTIVTSPPKATPALLLKYLLNASDLVPDKDVTLLYVGSQATRRTLMHGGRADGIIDSVTGTLELNHKMKGLRVLIPPSEMPVQLLDGVGMSAEVAMNRPDYVRKVVRAVAKANAFARKNPEKTGELLGNYMKKPQFSKELGEAFIASLPDSIIPTQELYEAEAKFVSAATGKPVSSQAIQSTWDVEIARDIERQISQ